MGTLSDAIRSAKAVSSLTYELASKAKASGVGLSNVMTPSYSNIFGQWQDQAKYNERYSLFRNWIYAAINAVALDAAAQPVCVGRLGEKKSPKKTGALSIIKSKMTTTARRKAANTELEILEDHPLLDVLEQPNSMQGRPQFVYSFIANLCLTGWGYVVRDQAEDGSPEYYSLPTTWIRVDHRDGPFSRFRVVDPKKPNSAVSDEDWLTREQVGFAHLPNPADPMSALAPAASQMGSIRINDHIETSRDQFFRHGIFPSVVVTVGKDPHPDAPGGGVRPRLTNEQRRQIYSVIEKTMGGVANYGRPAIVDGLIESITRFSMTDQEMGWEKSEASVKAAILSAFCVHPYLLGTEASVGGYAQVANIEKRFYKRVNAYLDMLGSLMTNLVANDGEEQSLLVWWEECDAKDPTREDAMLRFARQNNDISQNEFRARIGLGPDEDRNQSVVSPQMLTGIVTVLGQAGQGAIQNVQVQALLEGLGLPSDLAKKIAGPKVAKPETQPAPGQPATAEESEQPMGEEEVVKLLKESIAELRKSENSLVHRAARFVVDSVSVKHLPGQHDQSTHGRGGGGVGGEDWKPGEGVPSPLLSAIPEYVDEFGEDPRSSPMAEFRYENYMHSRRAIEEYLSGKPPEVSYSHGDYTTATMSNRVHLFIRKGDPKPAPAGTWQGWWDPDLEEVLGVSSSDYSKMSYKEKMLADAKVQTIKYAAGEFELLKGKFWDQGKRGKSIEDDLEDKHLPG